MNKFYFKIIVPAVISIFFFVSVIFFFIIPHSRENIMKEKREMIKELTNTAWSILVKYENDEKTGLVSREEAQKTAISRIQYLRYGEENKDYYWITDLTPKMIMHPFRPDLNGKDLNNFEDLQGKKLFVEAVNVVSQYEHGYIDYMWQWKDDSTKIVPKLSYVKLFKPWGWIIGTGIYIEDVKKEMNKLTRNLLWMSVGISVLIAFILIFLSIQSITLEKKRLQILEQLHQSQEKYRTLVESASEGLLTLVDNKITFANFVFSRLTDFSPEDLSGMNFKDFIHQSNTSEIKKQFSETIIKEGQYFLNLKTKIGDYKEVIVTVTIITFFNTKMNVLIIKDITSDNEIKVSKVDYKSLLNTLNVGLFRAEIDTKGKFLYANDTTLKILGFDSFKELSNVHILQLLADKDDRKLLRKIIAEKGYIKNKVLKIYKKNRDLAIVSVSLFAFNKENNQNLICDGVIEDITIGLKEIENKEKLITHLKSQQLLLGQKVINHIEEITYLNVDSTISDVINIFKTKNSDCLFLCKSNDDIMGIVTGSDIQRRVIELQLNLDNPAYLIMSSPVQYINSDKTVEDAVIFCEQNRINHLLVKSDSGLNVGLFSLNKFYPQLKNNISFLKSLISRSQNPDELKDIYNMYINLVKPLIKNDISIEYITRLSSDFSDEITRKIIDLSIQEIGKPPVDFAFICLGSLGRKEETLLTDQDNAIVYQNTDESLREVAKKYFLKLGKKVSYYLDKIGYKYCIGEVMASNEKWCQPLKVWEMMFKTWINQPEPKNLLDASIFFDLRTVYGSDYLVDKLRNIIINEAPEQNQFLYHLANNAFNSKNQHIIANEYIDLKNAVIPIIMFARVYALKNGITNTNTLERLNMLREKNLIKEELVKELIFIYGSLMKYRFKNQLINIENQIEISNKMLIGSISETELSLLKKLVSSIPDYISLLKYDFRLDV